MEIALVARKDLFVHGSDYFVEPGGYLVVEGSTSVHVMCRQVVKPTSFSPARLARGSGDTS